MSSQVGLSRSGAALRHQDQQYRTSVAKIQDAIVEAPTGAAVVKSLRRPTTAANRGGSLNVNSR
jgi:hypothetical protein